MKLHYSSEPHAEHNLRRVRAVAELLETPVEYVLCDSIAKLAPLSPISLFPLLETPSGTFFSTDTIVRYLASISHKGAPFYGGNSIHIKSLVDQWIDVSTCQFDVGAVGVVAIVNKQGQDLDTKQIVADLHKFIKIVEAQLHKGKFLTGDSPSIADISIATTLSIIFEHVFGEKERSGYPKTLEWYTHLANLNKNIGSVQLPKEGKKQFSEEAGKKQNKKEGKKEGKKEEKPPAAPAAEEDDLFDSPAAPVVAVPKPAAKPKKEKPIAKSIISFDVKVYEQETDLNALAAKIKNEIKLPGLVWSEEFKILPVAFGMNKLQLSCVVEDDKVSTEDFTEVIESWEDVQSTDIVTFQKL